MVFACLLLKCVFSLFHVIVDAHNLGTQNRFSSSLSVCSPFDLVEWGANLICASADGCAVFRTRRLACSRNHEPASARSPMHDTSYALVQHKQRGVIARVLAVVGVFFERAEVRI